MNKVPHDPDEILSVVDEEDNIIGSASRKEIHKKGLMHRESYTYIINSKNQVLLQKRIDRGIWDSSSSGHIPREQDYLSSAVRELKEELGFNIDKSEFIEISKERFCTSSNNKINNRFVKLFLIKKDIPLKDFKIEKTEIEFVKYFSLEELNELLSSKEKVITSSAKNLIKKYIIKEMR